MSIVCFGSYENSTALGVKEEKKVFSLFHSLSYSASSNWADDTDQQLFNQGVSYGGTYFYKQQYYMTLGLAATYQTVDNALVETDNGSFHFTDLSVGFGTKGFNLYKGKTDSISLFTNIRNVFPLSERSRNEGYKSVPSGSMDLAYQTGPLGLVLSGNYAYVINTYDTRLFNSQNGAPAGTPNLESSTSGSLTARYNFWRLRAQFSYRIGMLQFLDGSTVGNSGNSFSLMAMLTQTLWAGASTSNFNNIDEQFVDLWFYDPYLRIYNLSMGVTF